MSAQESQGVPVLILKKEDRNDPQVKKLKNNITAAKVVAETVRSTLGLAEEWTKCSSAPSET